ncbi:MAG TPA: DUF5606 domain-containing protein [Puia sp.]|jgi:hypothetical protein|nr:DUF5606 domain-containing protein [Puia sp.]
MEYSKIVAVTGLPSLFELISSKADGAVVRSLDDKSTKFVSSRIHKMTQLETIEVFTTKDNVNLVEVFKALESSGEKLPDEKDNAALSAYFKKAFPDLDFEKVYASDMKKMVKWFTVLKANHIELKLSEPPAEEEEPVVEEKKEEPVVKKKKEEKIVAKEEKKETKAPKETPAKKKTTPAKKEAVPKKHAEEKEEKPKKTTAPKKDAAKTKTKKK